MKINKKIGKSIVATVLGTTAVSCANPPSALGGLVDFGLDFKRIDDTELGKAITGFINKLDPKEFASTVKSFEALSSNFSSISGGLKYAAYGLAGLVGINLFKDIYNAVYNFSDFVSNSKEYKKVVQYSFSLPEIKMRAEKVLCDVESAERLVTIFRSQFSKFGFLNKSKDAKFRNNMVLGLSGNAAAGVRLWSEISNIFFGSGLDVCFEQFDSKSITPREFLERLNESSNQNKVGLRILVYDGELNVTNDEDKTLKKNCSSFLVELNRYSVDEVCNMLENEVKKQFKSEFIGKNISVILTEDFLKSFSKVLVSSASVNPNLISDAASSIVTKINSYINKNSLSGGIVRTLKIKVDTKNKKIDGLTISHYNELVPQMFLPDYISGFLKFKDE